MEDSNLSYTYREIADLLIDCDKDVDVVFGIIAINNQHVSETNLNKLKRFLQKSFITQFKAKWAYCKRTKEKFISDNREWLSKVYSSNDWNHDDEEQHPSHLGKRGRPNKSYEDSTMRSKRTKLREFCENHSQELILNAAKQIDNSEQLKCFSPEKALSLILDASLSKHQYEVLRSSAKAIGCDIFPSYKTILKVKTECYPGNVCVEETCSKVGLQELLDHTVTRLLKTKTEDELFEFPSQLQLISKWGCDGSSGHSEYHQKFTNESDSDKHMFLTSLVPLTLTELNNESTIIWKNTEPSTTRFCRPLRFKFVKETANVISEEVDRVKAEISKLENTVIEIHNRRFDVSHNLALTMIDGKVATTLTGSYSMSVCFICGAKPIDMNNFESLVSRTNAIEGLRFGISHLHARIKFMECILHIAYNKSFAAWITNKETKEIKEAAKAEVQRNLKWSLGINVDVVKQGMGSSNDGNTSRRFFENPSITADATGINENLIHRFKIILTTINCSRRIDTGKFHEYCMATAKLYVQLYGWYYMPITVHKVLIHGSKIISEAILPIGMLSEEAQEARNKDLRNYRLYHSRKKGRIETNEDVMHNLLLSSDPFINSFRTKLKLKKLELPDEVKQLLKE